MTAGTGGGSGVRSDVLFAVGLTDRLGEHESLKSVACSDSIHVELMALNDIRQSIVFCLQAWPSIVLEAVKNTSELILNLGEVNFLNVENDIPLLNRFKVVAPNSVEDDVAALSLLLGAARILSLEDQLAIDSGESISAACVVVN